MRKNVRSTTLANYDVSFILTSDILTHSFIFYREYYIIDFNFNMAEFSFLEYGPALIDHALLGVGLSGSSKLGTDIDPEKDLDKIIQALQEAEQITVQGAETQSKVRANGTTVFYSRKKFKYPIFWRSYA